MTIKQVKDNFNKEKRREAFNRLRNKSKNAGKQKDDKSWQKELQDFYSIDDIEVNKSYYSIEESEDY
jgi:hypothetical protein